MNEMSDIITVRPTIVADLAQSMAVPRVIENPHRDVLGLHVLRLWQKMVWNGTLRNSYSSDNKSLQANNGGYSAYQSAVGLHGRNIEMR